VNVSDPLLGYSYNFAGDSYNILGPKSDTVSGQSLGKHSENRISWFDEG